MTFKKLVFVLVVFTWCCHNMLYGQLAFERGAFTVDGQTFTSGAPMGCADINGDGLDDLLILDDARVLYIVYQTQGFRSEYLQHLGKISDDRNWAVQVADVDQNGVQDIFVANSFNKKIYFGTGVQPSFTPVHIPSAGFLPQGSNFVDMDNDLDLDLFVCNDVGENFLALNDGAGNFKQIDTLIDFSTDPSSDLSGNYGSTWCDFDRDGDQDLYIAKCRGNAPPGDPRRTNQFFRNTPDGFEPIAEFPELLSNAQSWAVDFIDIENDGDWDILLANHDAPMNLFVQQDDGSFVDESTLRGIDFESGVIQLVSADYDNDGDTDVFVAGTDHILYINDGNGMFTVGAFPENQEKQIESAVCGDFNGDGAIDLYAGFANLYNDPTDIPDELYLNKSVVGNYLKLILKGKISNTNAIGATVEIYHGDRFQMREIRSGESYGINKSSIVHFGLDTFTQVDSVKIYWPTGQIQSLVNVGANSTVYVHETDGWFSSSSLSIVPDQPAMCESDSLTLTAPDADSYEWSTGDTTAEIVVHTEGVYYVQIVRNGIRVTCPVFQVKKEDRLNPKVDVIGQENKCAGDTIVLFANGIDDYAIEWNRGDTTRWLEVTDDGPYFYSELRYCADFMSDTVYVQSYAVPAFETENDTVVNGFDAVLRSSTEQTFWIADTLHGGVFAEGDSIQIFNLTRDSVVFAASYSQNPSEVEHIGILMPNPVLDGYHHTSLNFGVFFHTKEHCVIESVSVYTRTPGTREIIIRDALTWDEVHRIQVDVQEGWNVLTLDADLEPNRDYEMITDEQVNLDSLGMSSPDFMRSEGPVSYPFSGQSLSITGNSFNSGNYYYFYDWQVHAVDKLCLSYWQPVFAIVDSAVSTTGIEPSTAGMRIYPNPTFGDITLMNTGSDWSVVSIFDAMGRLIEERGIQPMSQSNIRLTTPGLYVFKSKWPDGSSSVKKILVTE